MKQWKDLTNFSDVKRALMPPLTMKDYIRHTSFYLCEEFNTYFEVTMKADKDVFGNHLRLDGTITPYSHYKIAFAKLPTAL